MYIRDKKKIVDMIVRTNRNTIFQLTLYSILNPYHPQRTLDYELGKILSDDDSGDESLISTELEPSPFGDTKKTTTTTIHEEQWNVESFDVIESLQKSLNHIYIFALDKGSCITQFMDTYKLTMIMKLMMTVEARQSQDKVETIAANLLHYLALNLSNGAPNVQLEDSFVHHIVSVIFESVFQSDKLLKYQWANGKLDGKRKSGDDDNNFKADFVVFVSYRNDRYDIAVSEVKPRLNANTNNVVESDLVKIGKEMKWMINNLIKCGTENPVVWSILLQGFVLTTYKINLLYPKIYYMIGVKSVTLPKSLHEVTSLPPALNITRKTALKAKKRAFQKSNGEAANSIPPELYLSHSNYTLQLSSNKKQETSNKKHSNNK
ncbi:hypothetical protein BDC45DRAFT_535502 [Circinella umbellata]|nr:hypothetical protein BDC45DRAFT_535502 [Circinella umbellata]